MNLLQQEQAVSRQLRKRVRELEQQLAETRANLDLLAKVIQAHCDYMLGSAPEQKES